MKKGVLRNFAKFTKETLMSETLFNKVAGLSAFKSYFLSKKVNKKADRLCMKFSSTSNIVHELEPKQWVFGPGG